MTDIQKMLFAFQDQEYGDFTLKLCPTLKRERIIGVRVPNIRHISTQIKSPLKEGFLACLPHQYYEEDLLHGFFIQNIKDFDKAIDLLNRFLPYANSWSITDSMAPKIFKKHTVELYPVIKKWIKSKHTYTVRFAVDCLMTFYLDEYFNEEHLKLVAEIHSEEYYIKMMVAWYYATALAKQWGKTISLFEKQTLDKWIYNKTIQKAIESFRITKEQKEYLKTLRIK